MRPNPTAGYEASRPSCVHKETAFGGCAPNARSAAANVQTDADRVRPCGGACCLGIIHSMGVALHIAVRQASVGRAASAKKHMSRHPSLQALPPAQVVAERLFSMVERFLHVEAVSGLTLLLAAVCRTDWRTLPSMTPGIRTEDAPRRRNLEIGDRASWRRHYGLHAKDSRLM
jgi:hypothetical protein